MKTVELAIGSIKWIDRMQEIGLSVLAKQWINDEGKPVGIDPWLEEDAMFYAADTIARRYYKKLYNPNLDPLKFDKHPEYIVVKIMNALAPVVRDWNRMNDFPKLLWADNNRVKEVM